MDYSNTSSQGMVAHCPKEKVYMCICFYLIHFLFAGFHFLFAGFLICFCRLLELNPNCVCRGVLYLLFFITI